MRLFKWHIHDNYDIHISCIYNTNNIFSFKYDIQCMNIYSHKRYDCDISIQFCNRYDTFLHRKVKEES